MEEENSLLMKVKKHTRWGVYFVSFGVKIIRTRYPVWCFRSFRTAAPLAQGKENCNQGLSNFRDPLSFFLWHYQLSLKIQNLWCKFYSSLAIGICPHSLSSYWALSPFSVQTAVVESLSSDCVNHTSQSPFVIYVHSVGSVLFLRLLIFRISSRCTWVVLRFCLWRDHAGIY